MRYNRKDGEINFDQVAEFLKDCVEKVRTQEDVELLNQFKKVFRKNVPLTLRSYVTAYLLKNSRASSQGRRSYRKDTDSSYGSSYNRGDSYRSDFRRNERGDYSRSHDRHDTFKSNLGEGAERKPHSRVEIDPSVAKTIFVGVGRNRRVFPRDLLGLLIGAGGIERERIGDIRVLGNYSFVQLFAEDADTAINALNGYIYKGRPLSVSYSYQTADDSDSMSDDTFSRIEAGYSNSSSDEGSLHGVSAAGISSAGDGFSSQD